MFHHVSKFVPNPGAVSAVIERENPGPPAFYPVIVFENEKAFIVYDNVLVAAVEVPGFVGLTSMFDE